MPEAVSPILTPQPLPTEQPQLQPRPLSRIDRILAFLQHTFAKNRTLSIFLVLVFLVTISSGAYVLVAPAEKKAPQEFLAARQTNPTDTPTPIPPSNTPTPSPTAPPVLPTETPMPTTTTTVPLATPTPTTNPTANWNTYINTDYNYSIKYPLDWTVLNLGILEPKVPNYVVFNPNTASLSARTISLSVSTRTYTEQLAVYSVAGNPRIVASILGKEKHIQDSNRNTLISVILPRTENLLVFYAQTAYVDIFDKMLTTLQITN